MRLGGYTEGVSLTFLTFVLTPVLELYLLVRIGREVGVVPTLLMLLASAVLGSLIVRRQGRRVVEAVQTALAQGQVPDEALFSQSLVIVGGLLCVIPGPLTSVVGLLLMLPFVRVGVQKVLRKALERRVAQGNVHLHGVSFGFPPHMHAAQHGPRAAARTHAHEAQEPRPSARPAARPSRPAQPGEVSRAKTTVGHGPGHPTVVIETEGEEIHTDSAR